MRPVAPLATLAGLLVGFWLLLGLGGGMVVMAGHLLARVVRSRRDRRHPQQAAIRERTRQARRLAAEWPLLAQTLGLGYRDQWTRQHRFPAAELVVDDQGVTATVAAHCWGRSGRLPADRDLSGRHLGLRRCPGRATGARPDPPAWPAP
jgi:hypothetical protein